MSTGGHGVHTVDDPCAAGTEVYARALREERAQLGYLIGRSGILEQAEGP